MSLREQVARLFAKPKPAAGDDLNAAASSQDRKVAGDKDSEDARKTAAAIDAKQAELLRTHLTPELTPYGTQPLRPPTGDEARAQAEKLVTGKDRPDEAATKGNAPARETKADAKTAAPARELLQAEKVDDSTRTGPLEGEVITPPYVADIVTLQAGHEVEADAARNPASWTREERAAKVAEQVAIIEAEQASAALTHTHGGSRTM